VLISLVSFAGYFAVKLIGPRAGPIVSGALGGLASSTAVSLGFSRLAAKEPALGAAMSAGIAVAGAVMFLRVPFVAAIADADLAMQLVPPLATMAVVALGATALLARGSMSPHAQVPAGIRDPSNIGSALEFGAFLLVLTVVAQMLRDRFGAHSLYAVALAAGLADVDAITLTIARGVAETESRELAQRAILLAVVSNTLVKMTISLVIAGRAVGWRVAMALGAGLLAGAAVFALS
jgi:uncharacterized membrane protein (DUF4010 family)